MRTHGYIAFAIGIGLTAWTCVLVADTKETQVRATFQRDVQAVATDTSVRLQTYFDMLLSLKGMFAVNDHASRVDFSRFIRELHLTERYPGFRAIQFVRYVPGDQLAGYEEAVRGDASLQPGGYPGFTVHPHSDHPDHYVIEFNEPMKGNESAFGLDLGALAPHRRAIELGRDSGMVVATERVILVQDATRQPGFVARAPVYRQGMPLDTVEQRRAALIGFVAIVFRVDNLMSEVVEKPLRQHLAFRIRDAANGDVMYDTIGAADAHVPGLSAQVTVPVAQRSWTIEFEARPGGRYTRDLTNVVVIAAGGSIMSALVAAVLLASSRSRRLALRLHNALEDQRAFQDSASVGIAMFTEGVIMRCNRGMEELLGYAPGELTGRRTSLLVRGAAEAEDPFGQGRAEARWQGEMELVRKDGYAILALVDGKALHGNRLSHSGVWVVQDITERKSTEAALVDARHGLEHSLAQLEEQKANVEAAQEDLAQVLHTLKQAQTNLITSEKMASLGSLVAGIAHELNTPIGNSLLTATALADMVARFQKQYEAGGIKRSELESHLQDAKTACDIMSASLRRAADLITSFKQVAVDQTSDKRRKFDLCDVVRDTVATFAAQLRRANCEVKVEVESPLLLDSYPGSVGQVLSNLINNAMLHAFEGRSHGVITITGRGLGETEAELVFRDDGVGMTPKILHQVFDPFFTTKMGQGGSGLGMNIVYNIVTTMLGGHIEVASTPGEGTAITMRLPLIAPSRATAEVDLAMLLT
ncbi:MAG: CHASE domain-containing protein [Telluria sp.]